MRGPAGVIDRALRAPQTAPAGPSSRVPARQRGAALLVAAQPRRAGGGSLADHGSSDDLISMVRRKSGSSSGFSGSGGNSGKVLVDPNADLLTKLKAAWNIFFPERRTITPKDEGKKRLRMILVADRCGMSADSLSGMRASIVRAMEDYVELEAEEAVEVNLSMDPDIGTIYSVAVPVRRVKPAMRPAMTSEGGGVVAGAWDPNDPDSDPSDQFPWGT